MMGSVDSCMVTLNDLVDSKIPSDAVTVMVVCPSAMGIIVTDAVSENSAGDAVAISALSDVALYCMVACGLLSVAFIDIVVLPPVCMVWSGIICMVGGMVSRTVTVMSCES